MPKAFVALLWLLAAATVSAQEAGRQIVISSLKFDGVTQIDAKALGNALQTRKGSRLPWGQKRYFDRRRFEADLQRIEAYYKDRGFPDARVTSVDPKLSPKQDKIDITIHIREGEPIQVAAVELRGFEVLPERIQRRLRRQLPLEANRPLDAQLELEARERTLNELRNHGYPYADVKLANETVGPKQQRVVLTAMPGTLAHFGMVELNGQASVGDDIILRQLTFKAGDVYSRDEMRNSQRKLYGMELFQFVNVESVEDREKMTEEVPVRITVGESKHRKVDFGVGYGSEERARVRARWQHVNFFGGARHASLEGRWSSLDRGVRAELTEPYFLRQNFSVNLQGQAWQTAEPVFTQNTRGGRVVLRHQARPETFWSVSVISEYQESTIKQNLLDDTSRDELIALGLDPDRGETSGTLSALAFDAGINTTNNVLDARRGYVLNGHVERAGEWLGGSYPYWSFTSEARYYNPVVRRFVVASRLSAGVLSPDGSDNANVPFHKRFFLGGASSIRGWGRFEVAPLSESGLPVGGLSMLDGSTELRFPVRGSLGGVFFVDYGNVWPGARDIDLRDLRYAIGPGLRYRTPIGPARFDFGYQINPIDNLLVDGAAQKRQWRVHFSIGQAF